MSIICHKAHDEQHITNELASVPESQSKAWRHKCAACAYEKGVEDGKRLARIEAERERRPKAG